VAPPTVLDWPAKAGAAARELRSRRVRSPGGPPGPPDGGGGGDGGGGSGGPARREPRGEAAGLLALALALLGITTLFATLIAVALLLRRSAPDWRAQASPALGALWASSACLLASGLAVELAARQARAASPARRAVLGWLGASLVLGAAFVAAQTTLWLAWWRGGFGPSAGGYAAVFFALTGLHALHVLGGLAYLAALLARWAPAGATPPAASVSHGALYWHFMGALWLVLFALLVVVR
jgi:cytochrome c oxidase subunit 3